MMCRTCCLGCAYLIDLKGYTVFFLAMERLDVESQGSWYVDGLLVYIPLVFLLRALPRIFAVKLRKLLESKQLEVIQDQALNFDRQHRTGTAVGYI